MQIRFETPNGSMMIVVEAFFPASKKDVKKLVNSFVSDEDRKLAAEKLKTHVENVEKYKNNCKARAEIHEMSMKEALPGSFECKCESRIWTFYRSEMLRANEEILRLKGNLEVLNG